MADEINLAGATGEFPDGKLNETDEGAINIAFYIEGNNVCLDFGTPVKWLGLPPHAAVQLADALIAMAATIRGKPRGSRKS